MYSKLVSNIFYLTLTSTILSPFIGGATLYLYVLIPFLDGRFYKYIFTKLSPAQVKVFFVFLVTMFLAAHSLGVAARIISLSIVIIYCMVTYDADEFYLYRYVIFNVAFGVAQFSLTYVNPVMARLIGPTSISTMLWGPYAGPTYTNFYEIFFLTRVSGLSREAGFFASLIAATFVLVCMDPRTKGRRRMLMFFLAVGFMISLSKMSLAVVLALPIFVFKRFLKRVGVAMFFLVLFLVLHPTLHQLYFESGRFKADTNVSITHRMAGYELPFQMDASDVLFGIDSQSLGEKYKFNEVVIMLQRTLSFFDVPGWGGQIIQYGLLSFLLGMGYLALRRINGFHLALITLLTVNISALAVTASTVVAWFIVFMDLRKKSSSTQTLRERDVGMGDSAVRVPVSRNS